MSVGPLNMPYDIISGVHITEPEGAKLILNRWQHHNKR
jgi:hypothetical protein